MTHAVSIKHASKIFGSKHALDNVTLDIPTGKIFGFLGPNGAGKTTMIRCMMDFIRVSEGSITILGHDAHQDSAQLKTLVGHLSSDTQLHSNWTAKTHIDFMGSIKGRGRADELTEKLHLDIHTKVGNLSSGNKQKLSIILAFLGTPKLLIMDEPTRGLDPMLQNQLYELLREFAAKGNTVFLSSHNLAEVQQLCDSVAVIRNGKIVAADTMQDILQQGLHIVQAVAQKNINHADFKHKSIEIIGGSGKSITIKTRGSLDDIIKILSKYHLTDLEVSHVSLEDVFMEYY